MIITDFSFEKEDFATPGPYETILAITNPFERQVAQKELSDYAKNLGIGLNDFKALFKAYIESKNQANNTVYYDNFTAFPGQPMVLDAGSWQCDESGVWKRGIAGEVYACPHPIMPVERLVNVDTGTEKLRLAFSKGYGKWRSIIADKSVIASRQRVVQLADQGIGVTSENAGDFVQYISDIESLNYDNIPERKSIARLGYIDGEGFSPYVPGLVFDGDNRYKRIFSAVESHGDRKKWYDLALNIRATNVTARIMLAASFASVLVHPCGSLPFFVHLWGGESGTGKTVALMLAASVWANPDRGQYVQTFNSTQVGHEKLAAFLNNLPLCLDELQLSKDARGRTKFDVYVLAEGIGRTRGNKQGGVDHTPTWSNCILTTGETPITTASSGAGAINRVIDIECKPGVKIFEDGHLVSSIIKANYGFAGREFVERLYSDNDNIDRCASLYGHYFKALSDTGATEKQSMAASVILTADKLATEWLFCDGKKLTVQDIAPYLANSSDVSAGERGYAYMCDWVAKNANKMRVTSEQGDVYGLVQDDKAYIIRSVFNRAAEDGGFSPTALLSYLKQKELIETRGRAMTRCKRINGVKVECVCLSLGKGDETDLSSEDLPF